MAVEDNTVEPSFEDAAPEEQETTADTASPESTSSDSSQTGIVTESQLEDE